MSRSRRASIDQGGAARVDRTAWCDGRQADVHAWPEGAAVRFHQDERIRLIAAIAVRA